MDERVKSIDEDPIQYQYLEDLLTDAYQWGRILQLQVLRGFLESIGVNPERTARLQKAEERFFDLSVQLRKLQKILGRKLNPNKPFKIAGLPVYKAGRPLSVAEFAKIEKAIQTYLRPYKEVLADELAVKSMLLSFVTAENEAKGRVSQKYQKDSYRDVENKYFAGLMPDDYAAANSRIKFSREMQGGYNVAYAVAAENLTGIEDNLRQAVREQIGEAVKERKSPDQLASDLYWMREDQPSLKEQNLEALDRNWKRVAYTEMAAMHETAKSAFYESQAKASLEDPEKAVYYVYTGGTCDFCRKTEGTIVRLIPREKVGSPLDDSLSGMGVKDPHTDIAHWPGKNNVGLKKDQWRACCPAHPYSRASLVRFYPEEQTWDKERRRAVLKDEEGFDWQQYTPKNVRDEFARVREEAQRRTR